MKILILLGTLLFSSVGFAKAYVFDIFIFTRVNPDIKLTINGVDCPLKVRHKIVEKSGYFWKDMIFTCFMNLEKGSYFYELDVKSNAALTKIQNFTMGQIYFPKECTEDQQPFCFDDMGNSQYAIDQLTEVAYDSIHENFRTGKMYRRADRFEVP